VASFFPWQGTVGICLIAGASLLAGCGGGASNGSSPSDAGSGALPAPVPTISVYAGSLQQLGSRDGAGPAAEFNRPTSVVLDRAGNAYVADTGNHTVRKMTPDGTVSTLAGVAGQSGSVDASATAARFSSPEGIAIDSAGNLYVADTGNHTLRKISPAGMVSTVAGVAGQPGTADGSPTVARLESPVRVAVDTAGNLYVVALKRQPIRKVAPGGAISTFAPALEIAPSDVAVDATNTIFVADLGTGPSGPFGFVRKFNSQGTEQTWTGSTSNRLPVPFPTGLAVDASGNVFVSSDGLASSGSSFVYLFRAIFKISLEGSVTLVVGQNGTLGEPTKNIDGSATVARLKNPRGLAVDSGSGLLVIDNNAIKRVDTQGSVSTLAGGLGGGYVDGTASLARFNEPQKLAAALDGSLFVADGSNGLVRKISLDGQVSTLPLNRMDAGRPSSVLSGFRSELAIGLANHLFVSGPRIGSLRTVFASSPSGDISEVNLPNKAGNYRTLATDVFGSLYLTDKATVYVVNFDGTNRQIVIPGMDVNDVALGIAIDGSGTVYVSSSDHTVRAVDAQGKLRWTVGQVGKEGYADGTGLQAQFTRPSSLTLDASGNLYVADQTTVRKITPDGQVRTLAGTPNQTGSQVGALPSVLSGVTGLVWRAGALYASVQNAVVKISPVY
jgi:sugar lactone lactonase YvrE